MALQLKLTDTKTINSEGTRIYLADSTGVYNAATNTGGYGIPNPLRSNLALLVLGTYKYSKQDQLVSFESYDPISTAVFNAIIGQDGWYTFDLIQLLILGDSSLQFNALGDILYDSIAGRIVKVVAGQEFGTKALLEISILDLKGSVFVKSSVESFFIANNSKAKLTINTQVSELIYNGADFTDKKLIRFKDNYNAVRSLLQGAIYEFYRGNKYVAQKNIEFLNTNNYVSI